MKPPDTKKLAAKPNIYGRTGHPVCKGCRKGYGSEYDGLCIRCRGGVTAWEAKQAQGERK